MNKKRLFVPKRGQTIVEAIVVIGIVVLLVTGLVAGTTISIKSARSGQSKSQAITLADQGMEIIRSLRDSDWTSFAARNGGTYCIEQNGTLSSPPCVAFLVAADSTGSSFTRTAAFSLQAGTMLVTVTVDASDGSMAQPVVITTYFTDWK